MINISLADIMSPLSATIDSLVERIAMCVCGQRDTKEVTTLKAVIDLLRSDVDKLKSTDMSRIFVMLEIPDVPNMPPYTTRDGVRVEETTNPES